VFNKVLVLSASAGAGHLRAAQAVEKALLQMEAAREVRHDASQCQTDCSSACGTGHCDYTPVAAKLRKREERLARAR
jgi:UDP-N-acetylglucosamine:LPS N-acetylglucosamine transferase